MTIKEPISKGDLLKLIEEASEANLFYRSARGTADLPRSVHAPWRRQTKPYPHLVDATSDQVTKTLTDVEGTLGRVSFSAVCPGAGCGGLPSALSPPGPACRRTRSGLHASGCACAACYAAHASYRDANVERVSEGVDGGFGG